MIQRLARDNMTIAIIEHTMQAMVRLVDSFLVLDHGAVIVEGKPESRDARQPRDRSLSRQKMGGACSRIEGLATGYSAVPVLNGVSIKVEAGTVRRHRRPEWRRQNHPLQDDLRNRQAKRRARSHSRTRSVVGAACATRASRHRACPGGTAGFSVAHRDGKSRNGRDDRSRPARMEKQHRAHL